MLWHDQTKVGNYDAAIRIPERTCQMLEARQRKTLDLFQERNNRPPTPGERAAMALFPTNFRNRDCRHALSYNGSTRASRTGSTASTSAARCPTRPATPWPPACCAPAPA